MVTLQSARSVPRDLGEWLVENGKTNYAAVIMGHQNDGQIGLVREDGLVDTLFYDDKYVSILPFRSFRDKKYSVQSSQDRSILTRLKQIDNWILPNTIEMIRAIPEDPKVKCETETFYNALTDQMQDSIKGINRLKSEDNLDNRWALKQIGMMCSGNFPCGATAFHEAAHLLTDGHRKNGQEMEKKWICVQNGLDYKNISENNQAAAIEWLDELYGKVVKLSVKGNVSEVQKLLKSNGILGSGDALIAPSEDICVFVEYVYAFPKELREEYMPASPIFGRKIELLYEMGYIRDDQYNYLVGKTDKLPAVLKADCECGGEGFQQ